MTTCPDCGTVLCCDSGVCDECLSRLKGQLANQSGELASALRRAEAAERQLAALETLADHAHERTLWLHVTTFTDNRRAVWVEGGPEISGHGESVPAAAVDLAQKLGLLEPPRLLTLDGLPPCRTTETSRQGDCPKKINRYPDKEHSFDCPYFTTPVKP